MGDLVTYKTDVWYSNTFEAFGTELLGGLSGKDGVVEWYPHLDSDDFLWLDGEAVGFRLEETLQWHLFYVPLDALDWWEELKAYYPYMTREALGDVSRDFYVLSTHESNRFYVALFLMGWNDTRQRLTEAHNAFFGW